LAYSERSLYICCWIGVRCTFEGLEEAQSLGTKTRAMVYRPDGTSSFFFQFGTNATVLDRTGERVCSV